MNRIGYRMNGDVVRPDEELIERVGTYWSCDLSDAMNGAQTMTGLHTVAVPDARVVGPAVTVNSIAPSINAGKIGLAHCLPGDVLVVAAPSAVTHAVWGGNLAFGTKSRGVSRARSLTGRSVTCHNSARSDSPCSPATSSRPPPPCTRRRAR